MDFIQQPSQFLRHACNKPQFLAKGRRVPSCACWKVTFCSHLKFWVISVFCSICNGTQTFLHWLPWLQPVLKTSWQASHAFLLVSTSFLGSIYIYIYLSAQDKILKWKMLTIISNWSCRALSWRVSFNVIVFLEEKIRQICLHVCIFIVQNRATNLW